MRMIRSVKKLPGELALKSLWRGPAEDQFARLQSPRALMVLISQSWKGRIDVARSCQCQDCTWCKTPCSRSLPVEYLDCRLKKVQLGLPELHSPKRVCRSRRSAAFTSSTTVITQTRIR